MRPRELRYSTTALWLFAASILLPQGIGLPLPAGLPNLDLPRLAMIALGFLMLVSTVTTGQIRLGGAPRTLTLLAFLAAWQVVSAVASSSSASIIWALGNGVTFWGFAFACISLTQPSAGHDRAVRMVFWIALVLACWAVFELVTQQKVFPVRNLWLDGRGVFSTTLRRVIPGVNIRFPLMSLGPYSTNLSLGGALSVIGGFLVLRPYDTGLRKLLAYALFLLAMLSTQSRAVVLALMVMLVLLIAWERDHRHRAILLLALSSVVGFGLLIFGPLIIQMLQFLQLEALAGAEAGGSAAARLLGVQILFGQLQQWWLFGMGPGSLVDVERVSVSINFLSDAGFLIVMFIESGLVGGFVLLLLLTASIRDGARSRDIYARAASVGLVGFCVTALVSVTPWALGIALVIAGWAESWRRRELAHARVDVGIPLDGLRPAEETT